MNIYDVKIRVTNYDSIKFYDYNYVCVVIPEGVNMLNRWYSPFLCSAEPKKIIIKIPDSLRVIDTDALKCGTNKLTNFLIGDNSNLTFIASEAFYNTKLEKIDLSKAKLLILSEWAFSENKFPIAIKLPKHLEGISLYRIGEIL